LDVPSPLKARTVLTFGAIPSFRPSDIASPLSRLRAVTRSPHYALLDRGWGKAKVEVATSGGETYIEALQAAAEVIRGRKTQY
jgi:hypothetical protein